MSRVRPACQPSCVAKTLTLDITRTVFNHFLFMPAMPISTNDFYHFIPLSVAFALPGGGGGGGGSQGQRKPNLLGFIFSHTFQLIRIKFDMALKQLKQFKLNIPIPLLSEIS